MKHTVGCAWNEMSRRYVSTPPRVYHFEKWKSRPPKSIKQGAGGELSEDGQALCNEIYEKATSKALSTYDDLITSIYDYFLRVVCKFTECLAFCKIKIKQ